ncbi:MAG: hypothetical protein M1549_00990 [Candidatus Dependentiae bacterium]|nr:hypothetical protein [Candidatus Dependentiae bacterium]
MKHARNSVRSDAAKRKATGKQEPGPLRYHEVSDLDPVKVAHKVEMRQMFIVTALIDAARAGFRTDSRHATIFIGGEEHLAKLWIDLTHAPN